jgi:hypothetical protein
MEQRLFVIKMRRGFAVCLNEVRSVKLRPIALECAKSADKWDEIELNKLCLIFELALRKQAKQIKYKNENDV